MGIAESSGVTGTESRSPGVSVGLSSQGLVGTRRAPLPWPWQESSSSLPRTASFKWRGVAHLTFESWIHVLPVQGHLHSKELQEGCTGARPWLAVLHSWGPCGWPYRNGEPALFEQALLPGISNFTEV